MIRMLAGGRPRCPWRAASSAPRRLILFLVALGTALAAGRAWAQPVNGFGLSAGYVYHDEGNDLGSQGLGVAIDEQFVALSDVTFNPLFRISQEEAFGHTTTFHDRITGTARHVAFALQVRKWYGPLYVGGHAGLYYRYYESLFAPASFSSLGVGAAAGWEGPGGWIAGVQVDFPEGFPSPTPYGIRLQVGYRWR
jgi:hypothetical protein